MPSRQLCQLVFTASRGCDCGVQWHVTRVTWRLDDCTRCLYACVGLTHGGHTCHKATRDRHNPPTSHCQLISPVLTGTLPYREGLGGSITAVWLWWVGRTPWGRSSRPSGPPARHTTPPSTYSRPHNKCLSECNPSRLYISEIDGWGKEMCWRGAIHYKPVSMTATGWSQRLGGCTQHEMITRGQIPFMRREAEVTPSPHLAPMSHCQRGRETWPS